MRFFTTFVALLAAPLAIAAPADLEARQAIGQVTNIPPGLTNRQYITELLAHTNRYRAQHGAVPYQWSNTLAQYANSASTRCNMTHTYGPYSENIYWTSATSLNFTLATDQAVDAWMSEQPKYTDPNNPYAALHYTALMWKASKRIGCAWSTNCGSGGFYFWCEMDPQGNVLGAFSTNVQN